MSWRSIVYGDESQVRDTVEQWAEHFDHGPDEIEITGRTLLSDGYPEGSPGAEISIGALVQASDVADLMVRLEELSGTRPYCWRSD